VNTEKITKAKVIVSFMGFIILMNLVKEGQECPTTVQWCDFGLPLSWIVGTQDSLNPNQGKSVAGFQDLTYGDEILAAKELLGSLYIFTRRAIWKMYFDPTSTNAFGFQRVYSEPENQQGCIAYPRTLVSTGSNLYYMGRDAIYHYNPYIAAPQRPDQDTTDWLHRATGVIFRKSDTKMSGELCEPPTMAYKPLTKELWISWPTLKNDINTMTLVAQTEYKLADIVDAGFSCYCNYRRTQTATALCNEVQSFLGASTADYCLKDIGTGVFYREYVTLDGVVTADVQEVDANYVQLGYDSILRGLIPTGLYDREKIVKSVLVDHDTTEQDVPCVVKLRIGNNFNSVDANDLDDVCAPQWREFDAKPLACPDGATISELKAKNQKPSNAMQWAVYEQNRFLFFQLRITDPKDTDEVPVPAIGGDTCLTRIDFSCFAMPLPA
jgi:hypothetical protein